ncbi:MAG: hypothetical protein MHM6MM_003655 [Cercozoa sp. M6MM]
MTKGTQSFGSKHNKSHVLCRRCGSRSYHLQKVDCFPASVTVLVTLFV